MTGKKIPSHDIDLFRQSVGKVKPVKHSQATIPRKTPAAIPQQLKKDEQAALKDMLSDHYDPAKLLHSDGSSFVRPGIQNSVLRKLKRGLFSTHAELDLHGMTLAQARPRLVEFLNEARNTNQQCVRIIHGKGLNSSGKGPVLKPMIAHWLSQRDEVLAYCSARPVDGGSGAVYVLLRKN